MVIIEIQYLFAEASFKSLKFIILFLCILLQIANYFHKRIVLILYAKTNSMCIDDA